VLVRQPEITGVNLNLFQFDYDLTMMVFFLNADEHIYGRYGGRSGEDADARQSLAGLRYAMQAALRSHQHHVVSPKTPKADPLYVRDLPRSRLRGGCVHCHQVKEAQHAELKKRNRWSRDHIWRYPLPDNLGMVLEVDRGNVVERIERNSPADRAGLKPGDVVQQLNKLPVHSFGDAQFALDGAPKTGSIEISWQRGEQTTQGALKLKEGWRKTDIVWRRSLQWVVPSARVFGRNLTEAERRERGLTPKQLAFWQLFPVSSAAQAAGVREKDIILGFDGKKLEMTAYQFLAYVRRTYLIGDKVSIDVLRGDQRLNLPMQLR
jgi:hypothetical protein